MSTGQEGRLRLTRRRLRRLFLRLFPRWGLRRDDILLASFPKSGNTWLRFLWANVVALEELNGVEVDFHVLDRELGSEYDVLRYGTVEFDCSPRLVKTHRLHDGRAFGDHRSVYLHRHPGDVMLSYYEFLAAHPGHEASTGDLPMFLRSDDFGVPAWCRHVRSWIDEATVTISYEQLAWDAADALGRVLSELGIGGIGDITLGEAVRRSSFFLPAARAGGGAGAAPGGRVRRRLPVHAPGAAGVLAPPAGSGRRRLPPGEGPIQRPGGAPGSAGRRCVSLT